MKRRLIVSAALVLVLLAVPMVALAGTSEDVSVDATPSYLCIVNAPSTWTLNGITGNSKIAPDTIYYSNPLGDTTPPSATVVDGDCRFTITNTSSVAIDLTVNCSDFIGGDAMLNSGTGSNGVGEYGAYCWHSGMTYSSKVVVLTTGSGVMKDALAATTDIKWGAEIETQSDAWGSGDQMSATLNITATAD